MTQEEIEDLVNRFSEGRTTEEEDKKLLDSLNASAEILEEFLKQLKVAKIEQNNKQN